MIEIRGQEGQIVSSDQGPKSQSRGVMLSSRFLLFCFHMECEDRVCVCGA